MSPTRRRFVRFAKILGAAGTGLALASGTMGLSCDSAAQAAFRQTATTPIGDGVKQVLGGDPATGMDTIVNATIDGLVASIQQAGR